MRDSSDYTPAFQSQGDLAVANAIFPIYQGSEAVIGNASEDVAPEPRVSEAIFPIWSPGEEALFGADETEPTELPLEAEPHEEEIRTEELPQPEASPDEAVHEMALANHTSDEEWEERLAQTRAEMESAHQAQLQSLREALEETAFQLERQAHVDTVTLATRLAEHLVGKAIEHDREFLLNTVQKALASAGTVPAATITVRSEDRETLQSAMEAGGLDSYRHVQLTLEGSDTLTSGGCLVQFDGGVIDARVEAQLNALSESVREAVMAPRKSEQGESA